MDPLPEEVVAAHRAVLEAFVVRARRVETHSLTADVEAFLKWSKVSATVSMSPEGGAIEWHLPTEEAFESLASRCRPFTLDGERVHIPNVLKSVKAFTREREDLKAHVDTVKRTWAKALRPELPMLVGAAPIGDVPEELASHVVLAEQWLYGDLVHNDDPQSQVLQGTTINQRYLSAVAVYGQVALTVMALLRLLHAMQEEGSLGLDERVWTDPVNVLVPMKFEVAALRFGEAITDPTKLPSHESRRAR